MYIQDENRTHHHKKHKHANNIFHEIKILAVILALSGISLLLFTNAQLFFGEIMPENQADMQIKVDRSTQAQDQQGSISQILQYSSEELAEINTMIQSYTEKHIQ